MNHLSPHAESLPPGRAQVDTTRDRAASFMDDVAPRLLAWFTRRVDAPLEATDLLNETLAVVWRRRADVPDDPTEATMWAFGVARRVLHGGRRSIRRRSALHERLARHAGRDIAPEPDPAVLDVRAAIQVLAPIDREIIRLAYWDGLTLAQAARLLDVPEGTVRSRHHRARQQLRRALHDDGLAPGDHASHPS